MRDTDQGALTAVEWGVKNHWLTNTDATLARRLSTTIEEIQRVRDDLGLIRAKSTESWKEWARRHFMEMDDKQKLEIFNTLDVEFALKMAEGNPASTGELTVNNEPLKIDIRHHLLKVYGPNAISDGPGNGEGDIRLLAGSEDSGRSTGASE